MQREKSTCLPCLNTGVLKNVRGFFLEFTWFSCILSNHRVNNANLASPSTSNSSFGKDTKEDEEYILEDGLVLVLAHEPPTRIRL
jgi:hypothetical protein